ncbi:UDP-N-acetylmuramate dehydrogenase [cf. Phormidesmis sp. LEGE 11477]|uniref:UDP-N-acetylmuramate dehydrogenase n=1 Tax=cf. Phormidesmis sp. LEGE 11477 TaxID=1828680 RepID=UPI00187F26EA|nr:UDP-N-acetylmuramate dehydrogenase [cf. Phormidesmis sp. LEGE 11477]MBE9061264.1 UDP-N-acetylmuramate dehydrogenase [cf. Phormidesmis sp. LEGE 11477]
MHSLKRKVEPPLSFKEEVPLAPYSTWHIGGPARWLVEPTVEELPSLIKWAFHHDVPVYFLGRGSNILIDDAGLPGLVVVTRNSMTELRREKDLIVADSGVFLPHLSQFAAKAGFLGFEFLIGIPGTVGGALAMNSGLTVFRPREMASIVKDFDVVNVDGSFETLTLEEINVGYRRTDLLSGKRFVTRVRFRLESKGDPEEIRSSTLAHLAERKRKQPLDKPTAGSTFKSPPGSKGAGWYIEQAGLKGFQIGQAKVSPRHANWIENLGNATAADVRSLIEHIQNRVKVHSDIQLEPEVIFFD